VTHSRPGQTGQPSHSLRTCPHPTQTRIEIAPDGSSRDRVRPKAGRDARASTGDPRAEARCRLEGAPRLTMKVKLSQVGAAAIERACIWDEGDRQRLSSAPSTSAPDPSSNITR